MSDFTDPAIKTFEKGLKPLHKGDWSEAQKWFEKAIDESESNDLTARARLFVEVCEREAEGEPKLDDPYLDALVAKNRGDLDEAAATLSTAGKTGSDSTHAYLDAAIKALRGDGASAIGALDSAIGLDAANRVRAFHDSDFEALHELPEWQALYEQE